MEFKFALGIIGAVVVGCYLMLKPLFDARLHELALSLIR